MADIAKAIADYRRDGANRFYPTTGQMIDLILGKAQLEAENPGAPDRHRTLSRIRGAAIAAGRAEAEQMRKRIEDHNQRRLT